MELLLMTRIANILAKFQMDEELINQQILSKILLKPLFRTFSEFSPLISTF